VTNSSVTYVTEDIYLETQIYDLFEYIYIYIYIYVYIYRERERTYILAEIKKSPKAKAERACARERGKY